jgi:hypothetical protein
LLLAAALMGCAQTRAQTPTSTAGRAEMVLMAPPAFNDFDEWLKNAQDPEWYYGELGYFYIPIEMPEGLIFKRVSPAGRSPAFHYGSEDKELLEYDPKAITIKWRSSLLKTTDDFETRVKNISEPLEYKRVGNHYVTECTAQYYRIIFEKYDREYKDEEILFKKVFWEQDGEFFDAVVPTTFTQEDIEKYCVAKRIEIR